MPKAQHLTGVFKLHNPSKWRRQVLDKVFVEYTLAMRDMLAWSRDNLDWIKEKGMDKRGKYTGDSIQGLLPRPSTATMASALKDGLMANVAAMLASYLEPGSREKVSFPISRDPRPLAYANALEEFTSCYLFNNADMSKEEAEAIEDEYRVRFMKQARGSTMPLNYCRSRDFAILVDPHQTRFFLWLKLTHKADNDNQQSQIRQGNLIDLLTGEVFIKARGSGILFPLEIGKSGNTWGWQYTRFLQGQASIQSAKLVKENGDYFLHTSFAFNVPALYEPETYLGIDRGIFFSMAYGLVDKNGRIIQMGHEKDGFRDERIQAGKKVQAKQKAGRFATIKDYRTQNLEGILHILVNKIIDLALKHRSMIVMEDLHIQARGKFYKSAWKKLHWIAEYKCKLAGVPFKKDGVWSAWTSKLCIHCGEEVKRNDRIVTCPSCGKVEHSDEAAGVNIARRALYRKMDWGGSEDKPGDWRAFHRSFANMAGLGAKMDLRKGVAIEELAVS